jgi:hypothetical protein
VRETAGIELVNEVGPLPHQMEMAVAVIDGLTISEHDDTFTRGVTDFDDWRAWLVHPDYPDGSLLHCLELAADALEDASDEGLRSIGADAVRHIQLMKRPLQDTTRYVRESREKGSYEDLARDLYYWHATMFDRLGLLIGWCGRRRAALRRAAIL